MRVEWRAGQLLGRGLAGGVGVIVSAACIFSFLCVTPMRCVAINSCQRVTAWSRCVSCRLSFSFFFFYVFLEVVRTTGCLVGWLLEVGPSGVVIDGCSVDREIAFA